MNYKILKPDIYSSRGKYLLRQTTCCWTGRQKSNFGTSLLSMLISVFCVKPSSCVHFYDWEIYQLLSFFSGIHFFFSQYSQNIFFLSESVCSFETHTKFNDNFCKRFRNFVLCNRCVGNF